MIAHFHYDRNSLDDYLRQPDGDVAVDEHLETCSECQRLLETVAAEDLTDDRLDFSAAGELLSPPEIELPGDLDPYLSPTTHPGSIGRFGRFEVLEILGRGGMGIVLRALDTSLDRQSAVKVLAPHYAHTGAARQRFFREAKSAAAVVHPHVVPIQNVDEQGGLPFLVMPVIEGRSLQQRVDEDGPLSVVETVRIATQIAEGLAAAHAQGLVHRDVKPANVLLENGVERVQITDFGLARAVDDASMTRSGVIAGTPQYMSPEQARGEAVDARSDCFSLGSVIYFMLIGRSPFRAETTMGVLHRIVSDDPRPLRNINPDIPVWLQTIVGRLLSKSAADRLATADRVAQQLRDGQAALSDAAPPPWHGRNRWFTAVGAAAGGLLLATVIVLQTNKGSIRIESDAETDVPIVITQNNEPVERLTVTQDGTVTKLASGSYEIRVDDPDLNVRIKNDTVTVSSGETEVATIIVQTDFVPEQFDGSYLGQVKKMGDPSMWMQAGRTATEQGHYDKALEIYQWLWDRGAIEKPSWSAVRRSFLLSNWLDLADHHRPALQRLRQIAAELEQKILSEDQVRVSFDDFMDFDSVNDSLRQPERTRRVFDQLDAADQQRLHHVFDDQVSDDQPHTSFSIPPLHSFEFGPADANAFFDDDLDASKQLDAWWNRLQSGKPNEADKALVDGALIRQVRRGLRHTKNHSSVILRWVGNQYIWGKSPQHPEAIELMYHACDASMPGYIDSHYAVYFGLSVVESKTPAILRQLVDLAMVTDDPNTLGRIAWGCADQKDALLSYLEPYEESDQASAKQKAADLRKIFSGELNAFEWSKS